MLGLSVFLLWLGSQSLGCFLKSDDFLWVHRTVADASHPWNAFSPRVLFGSYYRPVPHLVWLLNYYVWGFEFRGHQLALILMWFASLWFIYGIGYRVHGRLAGFLAAACVGLNRIYIAVVSWKAWFTTLTEYVLVLACIWVYLTALRNRSRRWFVGAGILGLLAVFSRELAPLVLSAMVFTTTVEPPIRSHRWTRRRAAWVVVWAAVSIGVLLLMPSYRQALRKVVVAPLRTAHAQPQSPASKPKASSFSLSYLPKDLKAHLGMLYQVGFFPGVVLFVVIVDYLRLRHAAETMGDRRHYVLIGAFVLLCVLTKALALLYTGLHYGGAWLLKKPVVPLTLPTGLLEWMALTILFIWVAGRGRKLQRMLSAWFVVALLPILFLEHHSGAYQLLALTAMSLYVGQSLAREVQTELVPNLPFMLRREPAPRRWMAKAVRALMIVCVFGGICWMLARNVEGGLRVVRRRRDQGVHDRAEVLATLGTAIREFGSQRAAVLSEDRARLVGLMLRERHGFAAEQVEPADGLMVLMRPTDLPLPVYETARPYDQVHRENLIPNAGFEGALSPGVRSGPGYRSRRSLLLRIPPEQRDNTQRLELPLRAAAAGMYAFGAAVRAVPGVEWVRVAIALQSPDAPVVVQARKHPIDQGWSQMVGCVEVPPGTREVRYRIDLKREQRGAAAIALIDNVYVIPVRGRGQRNSTD